MTIELTRYTSTPDSRCGTLTYTPTADVVAVGDTGNIFANNKATLTDASASDSLILQLNNMDNYPIGDHIVKINVGLSVFPGITAYSVLVPFTVFDCEVKDLLVGNQEFGENLGFDATLQKYKTYAFKNFT